VHLPDVHPVWEIPPITRAFNLGRRGSSTGLELPRLRQAPDAAAQGRQLYALRLHELDRLLGGVFDWIERNAAGETLVVLTADHGTPWHYLRAERPKVEPYLVDDRTAVSLLMRGPGVPSMTRSGLTAPTLDLLPTVLARAGFQAPGDIDGRDLLDSGYHRDHVISEALFGGVYEIAVRDGRRTYIERYPMAEHAPARVTGDAVFHGLYPAGTDDYRAPLDEAPGRLAEVARTHVERLLKTGVAA
jgi:hypothetical protein